VAWRERRVGLEVEVVVFERQGVEKLYVLVEWAGDTVMVGSEMQGVWGVGCGVVVVVVMVVVVVGGLVN